MKNIALAFGLACLSASAIAAPPVTEPVDVTVTNAVVPVEVSNADPVPVEVVSLPLPVSELPSNRYQRTVSVDEWKVTTPGNSLITISGSILGIPSDKILVLEFVSVQALVNSGDNVLVDITCQGAAINVNLANVVVPLTATGPFDGREYLIGSAPAKCYTGSGMIISMLRNSDVPANNRRSGQVSLVGFLMDRPQ